MLILLMENTSYYYCEYEHDQTYIAYKARIIVDNAFGGMVVIQVTNVYYQYRYA